MTISAKTGPYVSYRADGIGSAGSPAPSGGQNPEAAPWMSAHGQALHDLRYPYTYKPGQGFPIVGSGTTVTTSLGASTITIGSSGSTSTTGPLASAYGFMSGEKYQVLDQIPSALSANNLVTSTTPVAATPLTITAGTGITSGITITRADTGATVTGLYAIDGATSYVSCGQAGTFGLWDPTTMSSRNIRITTNADDTGGSYLVVGYDLWGYPMSESITGVNNTVTGGKKAFKYIASITPAGTLNSTALTIGTGDVYGLPLRGDRITQLEAWWGSPQGMITGPGGSLVPAEQTFYSGTVTNSGIANSGVYYTVPIPVDFTVVRVGYIVDVAVTTGSKLATITAGINGTAMTGGVISLTSAAMTPAGAEIGSTAITALNTSPSIQSTVTITIASPCVITWPNHGLVATTPVVFSTTGALPTGLTAGTVYYVIAGGLTTNAFEVAATSGGSAINTSGTQSGVQTCTALSSVTFTASSVTTFSEGSGRFFAVVVNNNASGGTFTAAVTTTATTTTGDVRGTIAVPDNSDGTKRLTVKMSVLPINIMSLNGTFGVPQNLANNNGT